MVIFLTAAFLSLGLLNLNIGPTWWQGQRLRLVVGVPLVLLYVYVQMPPLVFPQALSYLLITLLPNTLYTAMQAAREAVMFRRIVSLRRTSLAPYGVIALLLGVFTALLFVAPVIDASGLREVPQVTVATSLPPSASLQHVRVVPLESAIFAGEKAIGQLGAYYFVGDYNIQVETNNTSVAPLQSPGASGTSGAAGRLVWVAPLEFQGVVQWLSRRTSPGVIVVSAENPNADAELRLRAPMRYIPSALLNDNLYRHVYMRYGTEQILETTLQLDDHGNPQYLCTLGRPTIGWVGQKVTGVVIVDPSTGGMYRVARSGFASLPKWVRRVYPPQLALAYNHWFGLYAHGFWNSLLVRRDVHVPARDEVFGLLADQNEFVWFVDHTSPSRTDQSMTGFTYMDTVSGKLTYYTSSGGEFNSGGAEYAVASNPIVRQGRLVPTQPILYNVYGQHTWVVPLVAPDTGKYQTLALVQARNGRVVIGSPTNPAPQADAFAQYSALLGAVAPRAAPSVKVSMLHPIAGTIDRIGVGSDGMVYFTMNGSGRLYAISASGEVVTILAHAGDFVRFSTSGEPNHNNLFNASGFSDAAVRR